MDEIRRQELIDQRVAINLGNLLLSSIKLDAEVVLLQQKNAELVSTINQVESDNENLTEE